jgi:hypothetical protein
MLENDEVLERLRANQKKYCKMRCCRNNLRFSGKNKKLIMENCQWKEYWFISDVNYNENIQNKIK